MESTEQIFQFFQQASYSLEEEIYRANISALPTGFILLSRWNLQSKYSSSTSRLHTPEWRKSMYEANIPVLPEGFILLRGGNLQRKYFSSTIRLHTPEWRVYIEQIFNLYQLAPYSCEEEIYRANISALQASFILLSGWNLKSKYSSSTSMLYTPEWRV